MATKSEMAANLRAGLVDEATAVPDKFAAANSAMRPVGTPEPDQPRLVKTSMALPRDEFDAIERALDAFAQSQLRTPSKVDLFRVALQLLAEADIDEVRGRVERLPRLPRGPKPKVR